MSKKKNMDLFNVLKVNTSLIMSNGCNVVTTYKDAKRNGMVVSLGDNQLLRFIRKIREKTYDKDKVDSLYEKRNYYKSLPESKENLKTINSIQAEIDELLFVPDLVIVKTDTTKKDYKYICKNKFSIKIRINNKTYESTYRRLCAGAGQLRRNSAMFVNEEIYEELESIMMCGLTRRKIGKINLSKFGAYFSLYSSAARKVKTPRVCVVDDYEYNLKDQSLLWIFDDEDGQKQIEERIMDMEINAFDGSGIISPEMAKIWSENLNLDYMPASFIVRAPFVKGLVSVFDFKKFAKEVAHKEIIKDCWGEEYNVDDIDVILTKSQFKMQKKYGSMNEYLYYFHKYGHIFSVARISKKENDFMTTLNYQYVQSNNYTNDSVKQLAEPTIDWLRNIMNADRFNTMMFLVGSQKENENIDSIDNRVTNGIAKALMYNEDILNDSYVRTKIKQMVDKKVRLAKIGKVYVEGSYDFAIPDLYALAEHAFGMEIKGILKSGESWNKRWVEKGSKTVAMMRSPLVAPAENQKREIHYSEEANEWFKYIYSGNIMSIWDNGMIKCSD